MDPSDWEYNRLMYTLKDFIETRRRNCGMERTFLISHPPNPKYLQAHKVAFVGGGGEEDSDQDDYDDEDDEELESTTPAVRSERPFNYVSNREEKQSLMFRNAQMVNSDDSLIFSCVCFRSILILQLCLCSPRICVCHIVV